MVHAQDINAAKNILAAGHLGDCEVNKIKFLISIALCGFLLIYMHCISITNKPFVTVNPAINYQDEVYIFTRKNCFACSEHLQSLIESVPEIMKKNIRIIEDGIYEKKAVSVRYKVNQYPCIAFKTRLTSLEMAKNAQLIREILFSN